MSLTDLNLWLYALDPIHVGTGTTHLSHVDLEIVRDPQDRLPKIPGTTLAGNARSGSAMAWKLKAEGNPFCAGMGPKDHPHCGACPVCYSYGTAREGSEKKGALSFHDALLVLFPLYSYTHGPLWITSSSRLQLLNRWVHRQKHADGAEAEVYTAIENSNAIALGRRIADSVGGLTIETDGVDFAPLSQILESKRIAVVSDTLFSKLVNENLEVRTSVAIDPMTGTAAPGALYRYEALPRASLLLASVVIDDARWMADENGGEEWPTPRKVLEKGLGPLRLTGLGRMGSRGFGRMESELEEMAS